ncbi:unnamed protein product [Mesocestoides corti]|uniref:Ashwin n=1 Tax=Mesocestoides corti TaxID=53468 RepID=A0A0R3UQG3_MESCO|nr:unnamed protein product [Mesocestoides corti]
MREDKDKSDEADKIPNGFFEFIPEDGSTVDLTQPGLLSRRQLVSIFRRRGFASLLKTAPDTPSLVAAYFAHILPLPARNSAEEKSSQEAPPASTVSEPSPTRVVTRRLENGPTRRRPPPLPPSKDLDSIVIISNPNWPTSGQNAAVDEATRKRTASTDPQPQSPLKRPKLKRDFVNLPIK